MGENQDVLAWYQSEFMNFEVKSIDQCDLIVEEEDDEEGVIDDDTVEEDSVNSIIFDVVNNIQGS